MKLLWWDQSANAARLNTPEGVARVVGRCAEAGITDILLNVRNPGGLGIYRSRFVPHRSEVLAGYQPGYDLLDVTLKEAHRAGLRVHAALDVFTGGYWDNQHPALLANRRPEWQSVMYGLDPATRQPVLAPYHSITGDLLTAVPLERTGPLFLNPGRADVQAYLLDILAELVQEYPIDGLCLDRARYHNLSADFSDDTRRALEAIVGERIDPWPRGVYDILPPGAEGALVLEGAVSDPYGGVTTQTRCKPGPYFGAWLTYRANTIRTFFQAARNRVKSIRPEVRFGDYVGSWYPLCWQVGANWASQRYGGGAPWLEPGYEATGYAAELDYLVTGCYYPEVTQAEARTVGASVEDAASLSAAAVMGEAPVAAGLFLLQYRGDIDRYKQAIRTCRERADGVMLFDLCYLDDFDWWEATREALA